MNNNYWNYLNVKEQEHLKQYKRLNKQTQNRIQDIFKSIDFDFASMYSIADNKSKRKIDVYIDEWQDKGLLKGYFKVLALNIKRRTRVKNSEILELLIYAAYIEEHSKINDFELNTFKEIANKYYKEGQEEVNKTLPKNKRKPLVDITDILFLAVMEKPNAKGYMWEQYTEATIIYNTNQIYRQATIDLQQGKKPDIDNDTYKNIIKAQINKVIKVNGDKTSGELDIQAVSISNIIKVLGISLVDKKAKVRFIADVDNTTTPMCMSLEGQIFSVEDWNEFTRYSHSSGTYAKYKVKGLALGLNLPPINDHFHWCRSTITYQVPEVANLELEQDKKHSIFDSKYEKEIKSKYGIDKLRTNHIDKNILTKILDNTDKVYSDFPEIKGKIKQIKEIEHPYGGMNIEPQKDGTYIIEINKKFFKDENTVNKIYKKDVESGFHPKGTTYKDMMTHELGHGVLHEIISKSNKNNINAITTDWNNNITSDRIVSKAFDKLEINDKLTKDMLRNNISKYAIKTSSETIAEAFADYYANRNKASVLSKEIVNIMKGLV